MEKRPRQLVHTVCLVVGLAASASGPDVRAQDAGWKTWLGAHTAEFTGVVLIGRDDAIDVEAASGIADPATSRPVTAATRFNVGSIYKTFTAVAIAQLIQQGRLALDDPLAARLPEYPNRAAAARITIRDLLTHRSGVAPFMRPDFGEASVADMVRAVGAARQAFDPGMRQEYSNGGYVVLGRLVEVISGQPYATYIRDYVFAPAGMKSTGFVRAQDREQVALPLSSGDGSGIPTGPRPGNPAGGGYSTAADLFRFSRALRTGRLLDERMTAYVLNGTFAEQPRWGFALREQTVGSRRFIGNGGGAPGVNAEFRFEPAGAHTVVVLTNSSPPAATNLLAAVLNRIAGVDPAAATAAASSVAAVSSRQPNAQLRADIEALHAQGQQQHGHQDEAGLCRQAAEAVQDITGQRNHRTPSGIPGETGASQPEAPYVRDLRAAGAVSAAGRLTRPTGFV